MKIISIVAVSENNVIGVNGRIPWHIPEDLKRFKSETKGHAVIMGRNTKESLQDIKSFPLPERKNIVLSKTIGKQNYITQFAGCVDNVWATSIYDAITHAKALFYKKAFLIGGENIYREGLQYCDEVLLTRVHETVEYGPEDTVARFDTGWIDGSWGEFNWYRIHLGGTADSRASFYKYVRVR